jgi:drug/metabolite transporter (DMT)-like permease
MDWRELLLGGVIIVGLLVLLWGPSEGDFALTSEQYYRGIGLALISAALAAVFSIFNSVLVRTYDSANLTRVELLSAAGVLALLFLADGRGLAVEFWTIPQEDWLWLALLASLATAFAFLMSIEVMKRLSPFTTAVAINMEPIYAIVLAAVIFGDSERMGGWFYLGSVIIVGAVFADAGFKRMARKKASIDHEES